MSKLPFQAKGHTFPTISTFMIKYPNNSDQIWNLMDSADLKQRYQLGQNSRISHNQSHGHCTLFLNFFILFFPQIVTLSYEFHFSAHLSYLWFCVYLCLRLT